MYNNKKVKEMFIKIKILAVEEKTIENPENLKKFFI